MGAVRREHLDCGEVTSDKRDWCDTNYHVADTALI